MEISTFLNKFNAQAHWLLRIGLAAVFLFHGVTKFFGPAMMGLPGPVWYALAAAETLAGVLILAGPFIGDWATRIAGLIVVPVMLGAIFMVHLANGFSFMNNGYEFQLTLVLLGLFFALKGNTINGANRVGMS
ncbi:MAG: DoxX family protein [Chloroflexota bacterium]